ncbi:nucleoside hydrolase [Paenibacillus sp. TRM 82003]|uniref:nucleoside hydrolase n=1 Tax=Kineococcus sp. TRM81007 TaxID=2925831 RepID=UPI001F585906|nr:nucleoside hydrolase [Kineococcus sp. TRM81007]MCI2237760.1 nucleoside hydrolase [Kineococcus sp. TRM81007]MCI3921778.1 nucleoside hydrolase [Paenibacillus sp. TRM 82003]
MTWRDNPPRVRVLSDNDYAGDPDGLLQLAHHALSPSVDLVGVLSTHLREGDPFDPSGRSARHGAVAARHVLALCGRDDVPVVTGSETALPDRSTPVRSAAAEAIVAEAMREDTDLPLFLACGAGLTEVASAWMLEPRIAERLTVVWIGGPEHPGVPAPPQAGPSEYNLRIDVAAAQVVFGSDLPLWQVPRDAYRQVLAGMAELEQRLLPHGELGAHLYGQLDGVHDLTAAHGLASGETYVLGDSPLVLLTALQTTFEADPASSRYRVLARPAVDDDGEYVAGPATGAPVRVYEHLDTRLVLEDLYAKLARRGAG